MTALRIALVSAGMSMLLAGAGADLVASSATDSEGDALAGSSLTAVPAAVTRVAALPVAQAGPRPPRRPLLRSLTSPAALRRARSYAQSRAGTVSFAVLEPGRRVHGLRRTAVYPSASVVKAMLLVAVLRRAGARPLGSQERALLEPMVMVSDNAAALAVYASVGKAGLWRVARAARMQHFGGVPALFDAQITAADQARLFLRIDRLVPPAHRAFARRLLSSIVGWQRWGIAPVAKHLRLKAFFKGGWRSGLVHQVALLERGGRRLALAVLTLGEPSMAYGEQTISGIAARVLAR
ncbi:MAG TPA: serine hydrolase [Solirubrobacteraceae bacterium]|nr:serine hydrolase [Solirubrobacteraceae bacterium]